MSLKLFQLVCERCLTNWLTEVVEMATLCEFDENYRFFTTFCDPYMGHTFRQNAEGLTIFFKFILFNNFWRNFALK
jgi:hypothetical protein